MGLTDAFMEAVKEDRDFPLINPRTGKEVQKVKRRPALFDLIVQSAWTTGEPGIIFLDAINRGNPVPHLGDDRGHQPLRRAAPAALRVLQPGLAQPGRRWSKTARSTTRPWATWCAPRSISWTTSSTPTTSPWTTSGRSTHETRKIGLGVMGFADLLLKLGIPYNSEEAVEVAEKVMAFIQQESRQASAKLADQRGNFPAYDGSNYDGNGLGRMRNATTTTIAPTGTISIISGCSSGIEPLFAVSFVRRVLEGTELIEVHPYFEELAKSRGFYSPSS